VEPFKGEVFNVGTGTRVSNNTILSFFKERFGELQVNTAPPRPGDVRDTQLDISHTAQGLGWTPKVSLEEGLMHTWKWWGF
jgi:nucleoside-diphosphate-sugar epimerase